MLIKSDFEVAQPVDKVWHFFDNIPQVAACLPGAELTDDLGDNKYLGKVAIRRGQYIDGLGPFGVAIRKTQNPALMVDLFEGGPGCVGGQFDIDRRSHLF